MLSFTVQLQHFPHGHKMAAIVLDAHLTTQAPGEGRWSFLVAPAPVLGIQSLSLV